MLKGNRHCWWSSEPLHKLYYEANQNFTDFAGSVYWVQMTEHSHGVSNCFSFPVGTNRIKDQETWAVRTAQRLPRQSEEVLVGPSLSQWLLFLQLWKIFWKVKCKIQQKPLVTIRSVSFSVKHFPAMGWKRSALDTDCGVLSERLWAFSQGDWWLGKMLPKQLNKFLRSTAEVLEETSLV